LVGGGDGGGTVAMYTCPINADGTLGTWSAIGNYALSVGDVQIAATSGNLYIIGGRNPNPIASVYYTPLSGSLNDYSAFYSGTVTSLDANSFMLPDFGTKDGLNYFIKY
jgi:hypothetical protein